jgi:nucleotide-binding universal stress UspA family protein
LQEGAEDEVMAFKDVLLQLSSYPEPTPQTAVDQAVAFAKAMDARITAIACEIVVHAPGSVLAPALLDVKGIIAAEHRKSVANARALVEAFESAAKKRGVSYQPILEACENSQVPDLVTEYARLSDVTMIPLSDEADFQHFVAEAVIFGSGRPVIVFPAKLKTGASGAFDVIGVAWDFSRPAARAVADSLSLLQRAKTVRVITVAEDKPIEARHSAPELAKHLALHGIEAVLDTEHAAGRSIGQVLADYAAARQLDLLVMGAYGHSRMREFILGGATKSILNAPPTPVLLSH